MTIQGLMPLPVAVEPKTALRILQLLAEVSNKIGRLDEKFSHSVVSTQLVNLLSLSESVQSTRIEGTQITFTDMMEHKDERHPKWEITEVKNYQQALLDGYERIRNGYLISSRLVLDLHAILMHGARGSSQASGQFRKIQNFIGPTKRIEDASYIPISADKINEFMQNWETFINGHPYDQLLPTEHLSNECFIINENSHPLLKAAIIHAQFESIHPFLDGNGRLGRILIVLYFVQSKLITYPIFFVSEELEHERLRYYDLLNGVRGENPDWGSWIQFFINACNRMAVKINHKLDAANKLAMDGLKQCQTDSEKRTWLYTFSDPHTAVKNVAKHLNIAPSTARSALNALVDKELLYTDKQTKRNKKYTNYELLRILRG
ncbi:Fic family protein [Rubeoparvulum massiliense]|uniref:Fic family protein n=1 Tax=Rubeoparvulum massiliense TaxID=1631346 RepID=UPI0009783E13|nr:Fic family protein [Rubeoparvulum massiliense]